MLLLIYLFIATTPVVAKFRRFPSMVKQCIKNVNWKHKWATDDFTLFTCNDQPFSCDFDQDSELVQIHIVGTDFKNSCCVNH